MDVIEGGTILPLTDFFVGSGRSSHTSEQKGRVISQADLNATNALQETGWQINTTVLDTAIQASMTGHPALGFDPWFSPVVPTKIMPDEFGAMDREARNAFIKLRRDCKEEADEWQTKVVSTACLMEAASNDRDHEHLYMVWSHDARLRRYPRTSSGPSPQGSGLSKSLIRFDEGVELGDEGLFWLCSRLAGAAGHDKETHAWRSTWVMENLEAITASARDPLGVSFWHEDAKGKRRDDPWAMLATAVEVDEALSSGNHRTYLSKLPINVDGTCNGLQHLSAMGLDPIGALATNLTADPMRRDIYMLVLQACQERVEADKSSEGHITSKLSDGDVIHTPIFELARGWDGKMDRNLVKRGTMTTPYGVTARGMRDQLLNDGLVSKDDWGDLMHPAASYMRDVMYEAIGKVVVAARSIMEWLQDLAFQMSEVNSPMFWETPTGSKLCQSYRPWSTIRPLTAFGRIHVATSVDRSSLKGHKQALAASPNFVHSFDAAHMALTINSGSAKGITHWSMIHDSYGTHAARMPLLNRTLREEFVSIYRENWLTKAYETASRVAPCAAILPPPVRGDFDIAQVLQSEWFFA